MTFFQYCWEVEEEEAGEVADGFGNMRGCRGGIVRRVKGGGLGKSSPMYWTCGGEGPAGSFRDPAPVR